MNGLLLPSGCVSFPELLTDCHLQHACSRPCLCSAACEQVVSLPVFVVAAKAVEVLLASSRGDITGAHPEDRTW